MNPFNEDEIYGEWKCKYTYEDISYNIIMKLNEEGKMYLECSNTEENKLFRYEGTYKFSTKHDLKYGQVLFNMKVISNKTHLDLIEEIESVYQIVPYGFIDGFKMQFVSGQTNYLDVDYPLLEFERNY